MIQLALMEAKTDASGVMRIFWQGPQEGVEQSA
jgi:hypothetical protein